MEKFLNRKEKARRRLAAKCKLAQRIRSMQTSGVFAIDPDFVTTEIRMAALLNLPPSTILTVVRDTDEHSGRETLQKDLLTVLGTFAGQAEQIMRRLKAFDMQAHAVLERFTLEPMDSPFGPPEELTAV